MVTAISVRLHFSSIFHFTFCKCCVSFSLSFFYCCRVLCASHTHTKWVTLSQNIRSSFRILFLNVPYVIQHTNHKTFFIAFFVVVSSSVPLLTSVAYDFFFVQSFFCNQNMGRVWATKCYWKWFFFLPLTKV